MLSQFLPLVYLCVVNCLLLFHVGRSVERSENVFDVQIE